MKNTLGLINYEGDCLKAIKENGNITIKDQYGKIVLSTNSEGLYSFIDGTQNITDSRGKVWEYLKEHKNAKPSQNEINEFLKDIN